MELWTVPGSGIEFQLAEAVLGATFAVGTSR